MGTPGSKASASGDATATHYADRLDALGVTTKKMFGGHGLFVDGVMFGMVTSNGTLAFKAKGAASERYEAAGSERQDRMPYWRVPDDVIEDDDEFVEWARDAARDALAAKK